MKKIRIATIIVLIVQILAWIGLAIWFFVAGLDAAGEAANEAAQSGAENGSAVAGAVGGTFVALFSTLGVILITILCFTLAFNTIIALIIYCATKKASIAGGIATILLASLPAGIMMIVEANLDN